MVMIVTVRKAMEANDTLSCFFNIVDMFAIY